VAGDIVVIIEHKDGAVRSASLQALTAGSKLAAALGGSAIAVVCGPSAGGAAAALGKHGAAKVVTIDVDTRDTAAWAASVAAAAQAAAPAGVLLAHTLRGKDLGPRVAERLGAPMAADCVDVRVEGGTLVARRPIYAGKALVTVAGSSGPIVVSLRPNAISAEEHPAAGAVQAAPPTAPQAGLGAVLKEVMAAASKKLELTEAAIVVSGGRGTGGDFSEVEGFADSLGAAVGASRAAVDSGWMPHAFQVGQTGKTVSPQLYVANGISGAIQHRAGMQTSKTIVAVNKDEEAPIFELVDFGVVGDLHAVLPKATEEITKRKG